jgi:hypothetical protein
MSLATTIEQLKTSFARAERAYAEGRDRHPALAPYESVASLLRAMDRGSPLSLAEQDAVMGAVLDEMRCNRSSLWQSILVVAFAPLLVRLRRNMRRPGCADIDQRVLMAFVEGARALEQRQYVVRHLHLSLRRRLFSEGRREHRSRDLEIFDDETYAADVFGKDRDRKVEAAEVARALEAQLGEELCDALIERYASGESLREYIARTRADLGSRDRLRLCDRLLRQERKEIRKLRTRTVRREQFATRAN